MTIPLFFSATSATFFGLDPVLATGGGACSTFLPSCLNQSLVPRFRAANSVASGLVRGWIVGEWGRPGIIDILGQVTESGQVRKYRPGHAAICSNTSFHRLSACTISATEQRAQLARVRH